jgi:gluconolactonase
LVSEQPYEAFHEAGVYHKPTNSIYISSNWAGDPNNPINITIYNLTDESISSTRYDGLSEANGGTAYYGINGVENLLLFADEGDFVGNSALVTVDPSTGEARPLLNNFFSRNFSSLNDVRVHPSNGLIYFTDSFYGSDQNFRPPPTLPTQAYTFDPRTGVVKVIADGFVRANGVEISQDGKTFYVSDTGYQLVSKQVPSAPASIYQYDILENGTLGHRRLFAYVDSGVPDGIHVDTNDNVYSGCGDGVQVSFIRSARCCYPADIGCRSGIARVVC